MKLNLKTTLITCAILTIGGFTSCNNDDEPINGKETLDKGEPTSITLTLPVRGENGGSLRADDSNATASEINLNTVTIVIYGDETGNYMKDTTLNKSDLKIENNVYKISNIETTTGPKKIFVGANLSADFVKNYLKGKAAGNLNTAAIEMLLSTLVTSDGSIVMTSNGLASGDFVEINNPAASTNNTLSIDLTRMVAKVTVEKSPTMIREGVEGLLDSLYWTIDNFNKKSFLAQKIGTDGTTIIDPNYWEAEYNNGLDFSHNENFQAVSPYPGVLSPIVQYTSENTSEKQRKQEITRVLIQSKFIPRYIVVEKNGNFVTEENPLYSQKGAATTFYSVTVVSGTIPEMAFFATRSVAVKYAAENHLLESAVLEYTGGVCYWSMYLHNEGYEWNVLRNTYYKCNITRILYPGRHDKLIPDPEDPPYKPANINFTVDIIPWVWAGGDYDLTP
jgi:hypothetical protein